MLCFISFSLKIYCNKDCSLTALHSNCGKNLAGKLNQISSWREKKDYTASLSQHSTLINILKHLLLPRMFVWQTIDDRIGYWQWTLKNYISTERTHIYPLVILVKYSASDYYSWSQILSLLFLKADVVADVEYCCWVAEVIYCPSQRLLLSSWSRITLQISDTWFDTKLSLSKRYSRSRTASSSIFSLYFSRCADATPIDTS